MKSYTIIGLFLLVSTALPSAGDNPQRVLSNVMPVANPIPEKQSMNRNAERKDKSAPPENSIPLESISPVAPVDTTLEANVQIPDKPIPPRVKEDPGIMQPDNIGPIGTSFATATQLGATRGPSGIVGTTANLVSPTSAYYYQVHVNNGTYQWTLNGEVSLNDFDLYLYDINENLIDYSNGTTYPEVLTSTINAGWYFLKVYRYSGGGYYWLDWNIMPYAFGTEYFILEGEDTRGIEGSIPDENSHYYWSDWTSGQEMLLRLEGETDVDIDVYIYDADFNLIADGTTTSNIEEVPFTTSYPTHIQVYAFDGTTQYNITIAAGSPPPEPYFYDVYTINGADQDGDGYYESWDFEIDVDVSDGQTATTYIHVTDDEGNDFGEFGPYTFTSTWSSDNITITNFNYNNVNPDNPPEDVVFTFTLTYGGDTETETVPVDEPPGPDYPDLVAERAWLAWDIDGQFVEISDYGNVVFTAEHTALYLMLDYSNPTPYAANNWGLECGLDGNLAQTDSNWGSIPGNTDAYIAWGPYLENSLAPGYHYCQFYLDCFNSVIETNENNNEAVTDFVGIIEDMHFSVVKDYCLLPPSPNPFNPATTLSFTLPAAARVELSVFDIAGREVARLVDGFQDAGVHEIYWDAADIPSGIYCARLTSVGFGESDLHGGRSAVQKLVLLK